MSLSSFSQLNLNPELLKVLNERGFSSPTPIQSLSIPLLLKGSDIIGQSKTGSGKTAAFAIPLLEKIDLRERSTQTLILSPTRELCLQVAQEVRKLGRYKKDLRVLTLSGGHPVYLDIRSLEHGAHIIVGTPGRILDHIERKTVDFSRIQSVVLDEADRMLDMGFRDSIEAILKNTPTPRQTILFSATFPSTIEVLSKRYQNKPQRLTISQQDDPGLKIEECFYFAEADEKNSAVLSLLKAKHLDSTLVFCNQKTSVDELYQLLRQAGQSADKLHGGLEQFERQQVMAKFRNGSTRILIATDVAGRGIDITGLDAVINFDMPSDPEQYVHRIGRTGRAGEKGLALSLVMRTEKTKIERLQLFTQREVKVNPLGSISNLFIKNQFTAATKTTMLTLSISGGRKDKLRAGDILGALTKDAGIQGTQVGKIEILDRVSYVALEKSVAKAAINHLSKGKIKGRKFLVQSIL